MTSYGSGMNRLRNLEAEQALLGCMMFDADNDAPVWPLIEGRVKPEHFSEPFHQKLFTACAKALSEGRIADPITLKDRFNEDKAFVDLGGLRYLVDLVERAPPAVTAQGYADAVADLATRRLLVVTAQAIAADAKAADASGQVTAVLSRAETSITRIALGATGGSHWVDAAEIGNEAVAWAEGLRVPAYTPTGIRGYDERCGGFPQGRMTALGGRPGMGKSALAIYMMLKGAQAGVAQQMFSLEMSKAEIALRMGCAAAYDHYGPDNPIYFEVQRQGLTAAARKAFIEGARLISELPIFIDERPALSPGTIAPAARRNIVEAQRRGHKRVVTWVDHLHIVRPDTLYGNRVVEVGEISASLAALAKDTDEALVALCQLSRANEARGNADKRPQMSDLRWAGEIEQDAAQITFIHRPEKYLREPDDQASRDERDEYLNAIERWKNKTLLINVKNRGGVSDFEHEVNSSLPHNAYWE